MKTWKYIRVVLYNDGYTTNESLQDIELIGLDADGTLRYKQSGSTNIVEDTIEQATDATFTDIVGTITASGSTTVTVTAETGASHTYQISVVDENDVLTTGLTYSSSAPTKATVSATGLITGVATGNTVITISVTGDSTVTPITLNVTVS
ncbi:Ig-like domain-containing protein [bacterium]|jgi:hypothetical protein|nr:Ig-like domain-containing protein [bacterium]